MAGPPQTLSTKCIVTVTRLYSGFKTANRDPWSRRLPSIPDPSTKVVPLNRIPIGSELMRSESVLSPWSLLRMEAGG